MSDRISLPEAIAAEIARVAKLQGLYEELQARMPGVNMRPAINAMTSAIERAISAQGTGDIPALIMAMTDLRGFTE